MAEPLESLVLDDELEDGAEGAPFSLANIDFGLLTSPTVLRSLGGIAVAVAVLVWPDRTDRIVARLIGCALVWLAVAGVRSWVMAKPRPWLSLASSLAMLAVGAALFLNPDRSAVFLGRLVGVLLICYSIVSAYKSRRDEERETGHLALYGLIAAVGMVVVAIPGPTFQLLIGMGAVLTLLVSLLILGVSLDARTEGTATRGDTADLLTTWLEDRPKSADAREGLYDKILYEGPTASTRIFRYFVLMGLAAAIASMGVLTDSTAVVIGAMLVAPLMTPLMGMAISLMMGWPNRLSRSLAIAAGGILFAIAVGFFLGLVLPTLIDTATNSQIVARTSPTTLDLVTAIAAGAAGAYALSRPDVSDSLSGVAIAISLVPPLTVVGIAYSQGDWQAGNGALLLFATNMITILVVGGATFVLTGVVPIRRAADNQHRVRTAIHTTLALAVLIVGSLLLNSTEITTNAVRQSTAKSVVDDWLVGHPTHRSVRVEIGGDTVNAVVVGPTNGLPDVATLADELSDRFDVPITVNVSHVIEETITATGG